MVCAPVRPIIPSLKLGDYFSVQAYKPCAISHLNNKFNVLWLYYYLSRSFNTPKMKIFEFVNSEDPDEGFIMFVRRSLTKHI